MATQYGHVGSRNARTAGIREDIALVVPTKATGEPDENVVDDSGCRGRQKNQRGCHGQSTLYLVKDEVYQLLARIE